MNDHVDKSAKNESTSPLSHCSHSHASLWSLKKVVRLNHLVLGRWPQKLMAPAPQHSQLAQLVSPITSPGKLVHSPAHMHFSHLWKLNQAWEKVLGKHSESWHHPELDNYEWHRNHGTRPECFRHSSVYVIICVFKIVCISSCMLWVSWHIFLLIRWHLTLIHSQ